MPAEDPDTHGVKCGDPHTLGAESDQVIDTLAHFPCGLVGKSDRKNIPGIHAALIHQISNPVGDHPGLTAACSRQDQNRSLCPSDGLSLLPI